MRVIVCGDAHIGAVFGLGRPNGNGGNTRVDDYTKSLNYIVDHAIETGADIFIQTGDIFEHRDPSIDHMAIVDRALKRLSNANIATFVIMGNHDYKRNGASFTSSITSLAASEYPNVRMVLNPEVIQVCNKSGGKVNLLLLPYRDRRMYSGETSKEQSEVYDEFIKEKVKEAGSEIPIVAVGHNFFYEGSYNDYGGTELMVRPNSFNGCAAAMMGHLHQFRVLRKTAPVCIYTGSMERSNFGDANVSKYFIDYNVSKKRAKFCKIPSRDLIDSVIDLSGIGFADISDSIETSVDEYDVSEKIVRLKLVVDEKVLPALDKTFIKNRLYDNGAFHVSKIVIEVLAQRIIRDSSVLEHKDDLSMFTAFLETQGIEDSYREILVEETKHIMGE